MHNGPGRGLRPAGAHCHWQWPGPLGLFEKLKSSRWLPLAVTGLPLPFVSLLATASGGLRVGAPTRSQEEPQHPT
jgi:hypothetical protein